MPKELTHWIMAQQSLERLPPDSSLKGIISSHHQLYLAGAVLPDTLLYLHKGKHAATARALADRFHDAVGNSFAPLIHAEERYQGRLPEPLLACLLGVISHMVADTTFHPFVYAHAGTIDIGRHYRLETDIDVFFLQQKLIPPVRLLKDLVSPRSRDVLVTACSLLFDPEGKIPGNIFESALSLHGRIQGMYDRNIWKFTALLLSALFGSRHTQRRQLFYPLRISQKHIEALSNPGTGETKQETLQDLAEDTVEKTVRLFKSIDASGSLSETLHEFQGENLLTGRLESTSRFPEMR